MSPDEFWNGSPIMAKVYRKAWELKLRKENRDMWMQGLYFYEALCDASPVLHAFAKPGTTAREYLKEPIALTPDEVKERNERDQLRAYNDMIAQMKEFAARHNVKKKEVREHE